MSKRLGLVLAAIFVWGEWGLAQTKPTLADVAYGSHERQVLDFYRAKADRPTPVVLFIHGGGWSGGEKTGRTGPSVKPYLDAGISVVAINYRYVWQAQLTGIDPPVKAPLHDAARALQFVRSKAAEWNIAKERIAASGGSAGACSSLWLAFHDDLADPQSSDPVSRESTRLWCTGVGGAQTSLDPVQVKEWIPNARYGGHAFGFMDPKDVKTRDTRFDAFLAARDKLLPTIKEYSPYDLVRAGAPPVYLIYSTAPALGQKQDDPTHSANYGLKLQEKCKSVGVECELVYPGAPEVRHKSVEEFLVKILKK
jgi:acetyl esterase/lipase